MVATESSTAGPREWVREQPSLAGIRADAGLALVLALSSFVTALLYQRTQIYDVVADPWVWVLGIGLVALPLALRRVYPVPVGIVVSVGFFVCGQFGVPDLLIVQIALFIAIYTIGAWEPNRTLALWSRVAITSGMFLWVFITLIVASSDEDFLPDAPRSGIFSVYATFAVIQIITNLMYFGGAILFGERSWRSARTQAQLETQGQELKLERQTSAAQAVALDRLEISRELHDVVAHHVSVMGVQAAAARCSLDQSPERAAEALGVVEESAQSAIIELHSLLHTLRAPHGDVGDVSSTVGVGQLSALIATSQSSGTPTTLIIAGTPRALPMLVDVALYRVVQEALTNVRKHAGRGAQATVRLRFETDAVEVEISDDGVQQRLTHAGIASVTPPASSSGLGGGRLSSTALNNTTLRGADIGGTGLGLRGMHERIEAVGGSLTHGRRERGGFMVRARMPHPSTERPQ